MTKELIAKLEALEEPEYYNIFGDVFLLLNPKPHERKERAEYYVWYNKNTSFTKKLRCQAWESAAIMLKPEGWFYEIKNDGLTSRKPFLVMPWAYIAHGREYYSSFAAHPAIALLICILKSKGSGDEI